MKNRKTIRYQILGSQIEPREHTRVFFVPWNILPSFIFTELHLLIMLYISLAYCRCWFQRRKANQSRRLIVLYLPYFLADYPLVICWFWHKMWEVRVIMAVRLICWFSFTIIFSAPHYYANCFGPMADAGYLLMRVIQQFVLKNLHCACADNTLCR